MPIFRRTACRLVVAVLLTICALAGVWAQSAIAGASPPTAPITVEQAVAIAERNNPSITLGEQNVTVARDQVRSAQSGALPTVGVNGTASYIPGAASESFTFNNQTIALASAFTAGAEATVSQPVWPFNRWRAPVQAARANVGINQQALLRTQQQVVLQARQAFFQLLSAQELLGVADYSVTVAQTQLKLANATFTAGTAPRLDVDQASASLADAQVSLEQAQNAVDVSRATLATQLGFPAGTPIRIAPPTGLPNAPAQVEPLVQQAFAARPDLAQLAYQRRQLQAAISEARLEKAPLANLSAGYNQPITGVSLSGIQGWSVAATIGFTLYNGGKEEADVSAAKEQLRQIDTVQRQLELGITLDVRQAWLNLRNALQQLTSAEQQRVAADEAVRISELRYQNGEGILLEVEQARLRATQARTSSAQARFQAQTAAAQLDFAVGVPVTTTTTPAAAPTSAK
jgi:outer membrane protein TolC